MTSCAVAKGPAGTNHNSPLPTSNQDCAADPVLGSRGGDTRPLNAEAAPPVPNSIISSPVQDVEMSGRGAGNADPSTLSTVAPSPVQDEGATGQGTRGYSEAASAGSSPDVQGVTAEPELPFEEFTVDDLLDEHEEEDLIGNPSSMGLCWWKTVSFNAILALDCVTAGYVPERGGARGCRAGKPARGAHLSQPRE